MTMRLGLFGAVAMAVTAGCSADTASAGPVRVSDQNALDTALARAKGGEVLLLAPGEYAVTLSNRSFSSPLVITSANKARPAKISWHKLTDVTNLTFTRLDMGRTAKPGANPEFEFAGKVAGGSNITFDTVHVYGSMDNDATNDIIGLQIGGTRNVRVVNCDFEQLGRAATFGAVDSVVVADNRVHHIRSDGFNFSAASNVLIEGNFFTASQRVKRDHPDAIQFWTARTKRPSTDIVIRNNRIIQGEGSGTQGIFITDQSAGQMPYERITIENNILIASNMANGIMVADARDVKILNNTVVSPTDDDNPVWIKTVRVENLTLEGNIADVGGNETPDRAKIDMSLLKKANLSKLRAEDVIVPGIGYQPKSKP